jgi:hypothetical protein
MIDWNDEVRWGYIPAYLIDFCVEFERLRLEEPILWHLLKGYKSCEAIASSLCWSYTMVLEELRKYKSEGRIFDYDHTTKTRQYIAWAIEPTDKHLTEMLNFVKDFRSKEAGLVQPPSTPDPLDDLIITEYKND